MTAAARAYHHGDLRNAMIVAAAELIEESGSLGFSMADAARRAGVSTAAPYRHFRDKDALLDAVAQLGFLGLSESARRVRDAEAPGSIEAIIAIGRNYISYVTQKAAFYDLMWGDIGARTFDAEGFDRKAAAFFVLVETLQAYFEKQGMGEVDVLDLSIKLWALVHGFSAIAMSGKLPHFHPGADVPAMMEAATRSFLRGVAVEQQQTTA
ncbi:MAG: TetR/AcrR family transcriptional regulator [Halieaceae bacterium]|jgi:AcrR family transcriptional regulator|nr:TetR/AcrR family transcriptional regulator [Halieaceae bacterium]